MTLDEAARGREAAHDRLLEAQRQARSWALTIAESDVRATFLGRSCATAAELCADELIVRRAAEHEAWADWQEARVLCGREALVR